MDQEEEEEEMPRWKPYPKVPAEGEAIQEEIQAVRAIGAVTNTAWMRARARSGDGFGGGLAAGRCFCAHAVAVRCPICAP